MAGSTGGATPGGAPAAGSLERALDRLEAAVRDLATLVRPEALDAWDAPGVGLLAEVHGRVRRAVGRLDGVRYSVLPRIEDEGSWRTGGTSRTFPSWLRVREGVSASTARKDVVTARRLAEALPQTLDRLVAGTLGADHVRVMTEVAPTSPTRRDALAWLVDTRTGQPTTPETFVQTVQADFPDPADDGDGSRTRELITRVLEDAVADGTLVTGEGAVLREAGALNADQFRVVARRFATLIDPDTDDDLDDRAAQGEFLDLSKTLGGYHVAGFLTDEHGALVSAAVNAVTGAPSAGDGRSPGQRRAQGLADVARLVLDTDQASPGAAIRPHLNVTVSWAELVAQVTRTREGLCTACGQVRTGAHRGAGGRAGTQPTQPGSVPPAPGGASPPGSLAGLSDDGAAFTESGDRAPRALLRRLACDSAVTRIVFGPDGAVLDVGRAQRTVTGQMRRAVIARDRHCVFPGCDQPPSRCEVHHAVTHWAHGGSTSVANSALLCWYHHQLVDTRGITMHWTGKVGPSGASPSGAGQENPGAGRQAGTGVTGPEEVGPGHAYPGGAAGVLLQTGWAFIDAQGRPIRQSQSLDPPRAEAA